MLLAARCHTPFTKCMLSASSADSTLRIVKEQQPTFSSLRLANQKILQLSPQTFWFATLACVNWWRMTGSNRRPPACKAGALPAELIPLLSGLHLEAVVGLAGFEPATPALSRRCSNRLSYRPTRLALEPFLSVARLCHYRPKASSAGSRFIHSLLCYSR